MSDLKQLESRITGALDRIRAATRATSPDVEARLAEERQAKSDLEARVAALKTRQDGRIADLEKRDRAHVARLEDLDAALQRLRAAHAELRQDAEALREAAVDGAADSELINRALVSEVEALRAERAAEAAEVAAVLSALKPALENGE